MVRRSAGSPEPDAGTARQAQPAALAGWRGERDAAFLLPLLVRRCGFIEPFIVRLNLAQFSEVLTESDVPAYRRMLRPAEIPSVFLSFTKWLKAHRKPPPQPNPLD